MTTEPTSASASRALVGAAALTVAVTVVADVLAGSEVGHVAALGTVALALGAARVHLAQHHRLLFGLLSAGVAAQPVAHAAEVLAASNDSGALGADSAGTLWYLLVAGAVVVATGAAETVAMSAAAGVRRCRLALRRPAAPRPLDAPGTVRPPRTVAVRPRHRYWPRYAVRRGPPPLLAV